MINETVKRRYTPMYVVMGLMFALLAGQLYKLQIVEGGRYVELAENNRLRTIPVKANRGVLYDRNGQQLVLNNPSYNVLVTAADLPDVNCAVQNIEGSKVIQDLAAILAPKVGGVAKVPYVIALRPDELAAANKEALQSTGVSRQGEVANLLSNILQLHADNLRAPINDTMTNYGVSQNIFLVRKDVTAEQAKEIEAESARLPGISVYTEIEYNFIKGFEDCLKPVVVQQVSYDAMQSVAVQINRLHGVTVSPEPMRHYVDGPLYSHMLGYVGQISEEEYTAAQETYGDANPYEKDDKVGKTGLEATLDEQLRGKKGVQSVIVNSHEQVVSEVAYQPPITGNNVTLTLDAKLQKAVTDALKKGLDSAKVKAGVAIVINVNDGQVLSMVSLPSYDNNLFTRGIKQQEFDTLMHDPTLPIFNRAVSGAYPPGSTFKMITAAAALQEGVVAVDTKYVCPGYIEVPYTTNESVRTRFPDWRPAGHGTINVVEALTVSSDVFFYIATGPHQEDKVIKKSDGTLDIKWLRYYTPGARTPIEFNGLGIERLHKYAQGFGLGQKTGIDLPGEVKGLAPDQQWKATQAADNNQWSVGDTLFTAIGQGDNLVTPLQLVNVTAAVANGGTLYKQQLVQRITGPSGEIVRDYQPQVLGQVPVSPENLAIVREGMRQVVVNQAKGTAATHITLKSFEWAGKTGTAEFGQPIRVDKGKEIRRAHAWFTAFAPFHNPEIAVVVLLEGGEESLEGSTFAVPVTDEILKAYFKVDN